MFILLNKCQKINMKIIVTEEQYKKVVYKLLDVLYGPNFSIKRDDDVIEIIPNNDDEIIFRVFTKRGRAPGCKKDLLIPTNVIQEIDSFISKSITRKKMFSRTVLSYFNEKTKLNIDCIEFHYQVGTQLDGEPILQKYNFSVKKNKKIKWF